MKKRYIVVESYWDRSGVIMAFGPFETRELAEASIKEIGDIFKKVELLEVEELISFE